MFSANTPYQRTRQDAIYGSCRCAKAYPSRGASIGPAQGISDNEATRAVVQQGDAIAPTLIAALDRSSWSQSVWIVFCLRQLNDRTGRDRIVQLKKEAERGRFAAEPHDLTLNALIHNYLRQFDTDVPPNPPMRSDDKSDVPRM